MVHNIDSDTGGYKQRIFIFLTAHFKVSYDVGFAYPTGQDYYNGHHLTLRDVMVGNTIKVFFYLR